MSTPIVARFSGESKTGWWDRLLVKLRLRCQHTTTNSCWRPMNSSWGLMRCCMLCLEPESMTYQDFCAFFGKTHVVSARAGVYTITERKPS